MTAPTQPERDYARGEEGPGLLDQDDERAYCILAERGLTPLHCDAGCQGESTLCVGPFLAHEYGTH